jgi:hypothetical protein
MLVSSYVQFNIPLTVNENYYFWDLKLHPADRQVPSVGRAPPAEKH